MRDATPTAATDFSRLDFSKLWRGRERTTQVERAVLRSVLATADRRRVLEVGAGEGRLTPVVREGASEFVALDLTPQFLRRMSWETAVGTMRVAANVHALPFVDRSFTAVVMERMYNFLEEPATALAEIRRVLVPGGTLILSYNPKPSVATLVDDLKVWGNASTRPFESATFSRKDRVPVRPSSFPAWAPTRARFRRTLEAERYRLVREFPTGIEDFRLFRALPARLFVRLASEFARVGGFPTRLVLARAPDAAEEALRDWSEIWACPRCAHPFSPSGQNTEMVRSCSTCGLPLSLADGIFDARSPPPVS